MVTTLVNWGSFSLGPSEQLCGHTSELSQRRSVGVGWLSTLAEDLRVYSMSFWVKPACCPASFPLEEALR